MNVVDIAIVRMVLVDSKRRGPANILPQSPRPGVRISENIRLLQHPVHGGGEFAVQFRDVKKPIIASTSKTPFMPRSRSMATTTDPPRLSPLSFPPSVYAKLTPPAYLLAHLQPSPDASTPPTRPSGRSLLEARTPHIHTGSLSHSSGSAVVRLGGTSAVCGIRAEILRAQDIPGSGPGAQPYNDDGKDEGTENDETIARLGLLVPNIELATGCTPANLPGNPPTTLAQSLTHRVHGLLHSTHVVRRRDLEISWDQQAEAGQDEPTKEVKAYWALYIDVLFISLDGAALSAAWMAILGALADLRLPFAAWGQDRERVVCDPDPAKARRLGFLTGRDATCPVIAEYGVFSTAGVAGIAGEGGGEGHWVLSDLDGFEEGVCNERVAVMVDAANGGVLRLERSGGVGLGRGRGEETKGLLDDAIVRTRQWAQCIGSATWGGSESGAGGAR